MKTYEANLKTMLEIWNTGDPEQRRAMAEAVLEHNVHFVDPNHNIIGREPFLAMVTQTKAAHPAAVFRHASAIDMQNNFCRHHWGIDIGETRVMDGFDVTEVNDAGKVVKVIGFFGRLDRAG
jgi:hypothetical protein